MGKVTDEQAQRVFYHAHRWITVYAYSEDRGRLIVEGLRGEGWTIEPPTDPRLRQARGSIEWVDGKIVRHAEGCVIKPEHVGPCMTKSPI